MPLWHPIVLPGGELKQVVPAAAARQLLDGVRQSAVLVDQRFQRLIAAVARIDIQHPEHIAGGHADIGARPFCPPGADLLFVEGGVFVAMRRQRLLAARLQREDRPAQPAGVEQGGGKKRILAEGFPSVAISLMIGHRHTSLSSESEGRSGANAAAFMFLPGRAAVFMPPALGSLR
jgi:hypothetical protein